MRFTLTDEIEFPRALVFPTVRDRMEDILDDLPNVDRIDVLSRREEGDKVFFEKQWFGAAGDIPAVLRPVIRAEYISWKDKACWDMGAWTTTWEQELAFLPGAMAARGTNRYIDEGDVTVIEMEGEFNIIPEGLSFLPQSLARRVAPALEKFVVGQVKPNLRETNAAIERFLEELEG